jgi:hypothetical protein
VGGKRSGAKRREVKEGSVKTFEARAAIPVEPSRVRFDLSVLEASDRHLALSALGPCEVRACYETERAPGGTEVTASVSIGSRGGIRSRIVSAAAEALLAGGVLGRTLERMAEEMTLQPAVR